MVTKRAGQFDPPLPLKVIIFCSEIFGHWSQWNNFTFISNVYNFPNHHNPSPSTTTLTSPPITVHPTLPPTYWRHVCPCSSKNLSEAGGSCHHRCWGTSDQGTTRNPRLGSTLRYGPTDSEKNLSCRLSVGQLFCRATTSAGLVVGFKDFLAYQEPSMTVFTS